MTDRALGSQVHKKALKKESLGSPFFNNASVNYISELRLRRLINAFNRLI